jgi:hypothetical protein
MSKNTLNLTAAQFGALGSAVAVASAEWEEEQPRLVKTLDAAWSKVKTDYYGPRQ